MPHRIKKSANQKHVFLTHQIGFTMWASTFGLQLISYCPTDPIQKTKPTKDESNTSSSPIEDHTNSVLIEPLLIN